MIKIDNVEYLTEAQWNKKHRAILKRQRGKGVYKEWYIDLKHITSATFYREDQTRPYNQRELSVARRQQRELVKTRKARLSCSCCGEYLGRSARYELKGGLCEFCQVDHTAWQWLAYAHMAPTKNAVPYRMYPKFWDPDIRRWEQGDKQYYYYSHKDVRHVSDKRFESLKQQYIKLYGGWEKIDLNHTTYDGRIWWNK